MKKPCGTWECVQYVDRCGGNPAAPSDWICIVCGGVGPMADYYREHGFDDDGGNEEDNDWEEENTDEEENGEDNDWEEEDTDEEKNEEDDDWEEEEEGDGASDIWFLPYIGSRYGDYNGKRILIIGNSHYCENRSNCNCCGVDGGDFSCDGNCSEFTTDVVEGGYARAQRNFACALAGCGDAYDDHDVYMDAWNRVAFYNYLQTAVGDGCSDGEDNDYKESENAFWEALNDLEPDGIIVWGGRVWGAMPAFNADGAYELENGKRVPALCVTHPSARRGQFDYIEVHEEIETFVTSLG